MFEDNKQGNNTNFSAYAIFTANDIRTQQTSVLKFDDLNFSHKAFYIYSGIVFDVLTT